MKILVSANLSQSDRTLLRENQCGQRANGVQVGDSPERFPIKLKLPQLDPLSAANKSSIYIGLFSFSLSLIQPTFRIKKNDRGDKRSSVVLIITDKKLLMGLKNLHKSKKIVECFFDLVLWKAVPQLSLRKP